MLSLRDQHVLILGLGTSGLAMARWCARNGAVVTVVDTRQSPPQLDALKRDVPQATFLSAPFDASLVEGSSVRAVFKSPGLTPAEVAPVFIAAHAMGIWVSGELGLFKSITRLQPEGSGGYGDKWQNYRHLADRAIDQSRWQDGCRGRQHRADAAGYPVKEGG